MALDKTNVIVHMEMPTNVTGIKLFFWHVGYYRIFIKGFVEVSLPWERLLRKGESFASQKEKEEAF